MALEQILGAVSQVITTEYFSDMEQVTFSMVLSSTCVLIYTILAKLLSWSCFTALNGPFLRGGGREVCISFVGKSPKSQNSFFIGFSTLRSFYSNNLLRKGEGGGVCMSLIRTGPVIRNILIYYIQVYAYIYFYF